jgi:hypothetical protein
LRRRQTTTKPPPPEPRETTGPFSEWSAAETETWTPETVTVRAKRTNERSLADGEEIDRLGGKKDSALRGQSHTHPRRGSRGEGKRDSKATQTRSSLHGGLLVLRSWWENGVLPAKFYLGDAHSRAGRFFPRDDRKEPEQARNPKTGTLLPTFHALEVPKPCDSYVPFQPKREQARANKKK